MVRTMSSGYTINAVGGVDIVAGAGSLISLQSDVSFGNPKKVLATSPSSKVVL